MKLSNNFKSISTAFIATVTLSMSLLSCSKDDNNFTPQPISGLNVIHASPTTEKLDFYVGEAKPYKDDFAFGNKFGYLDVYSGERPVSISKKGVEAKLLSEKITLDNYFGYSLFIIDKLETVKFLLLKDDLSNPPAGKAKIRFVNLSPDAPALSVKIVGKEADLFGAKPFKEYSTFEAIDAAEKVSFEFKNGTAVETTLADVKIQQGKIYTIYVKGLKAATDATKLSASVFAH